MGCYKHRKRVHTKEIWNVSKHKAIARTHGFVFGVGRERFRTNEMRCLGEKQETNITEGTKPRNERRETYIQDCREHIQDCQDNCSRVFIFTSIGNSTMRNKPSLSSCKEKQKEHSNHTNLQETRTTAWWSETDKTHTNQNHTNQNHTSQIAHTRSHLPET